MAIQVTLECGHASMLRVRTTPEGYTHDWEVFVRGVDNADISQYVDKVVFHLHETFPKPKRTLKEPPYMVKESGYAGFVIPIDVYLKNKDEPKKIQIQYDLHLQPSGPAINNVIRHHETFANPSEEFRKKLLKGGGVAVSNPEDSTEKEFKMVPPMVSKPKLSGTDVKKHRVTEVRSSNSFADLFGNPMTLPAKVSPESKKSSSEKIVSSKVLPEKSDKIEKPTKVKHSPHKERKKDKSNEDRKDKKDRSLTKEKDRAKEKLKRPPSPGDKEESYPVAKKSSLPSPSKNKLVPPVPPAVQKPQSPKPKEKEHKKASVDKEKERSKDNFKVPIEDRKFDRKKKKHKEDKSKERKEKEKDKDADHEKIKDSSKKSDKKIIKSDRHEKTEKDRNSEVKAPKDGRKSPKNSKDRDKVKTEKSDRNEIDKVKDSRSDKDKQKHKHKKKDKKDRGDETADKEKQKSSEKKTSYSNSSPINPLSTLLAEMPERDSSDSPHSVDEDSISLIKSGLTPKRESEEITNPVLSSDLSKPLSPRVTTDTKNEGEEKVKKEKTKSARSEERECRKRKRKLESMQDEVSVKREKDRGSSLSPSIEPVSSSQSPISVDVDSCYAVKENSSSHKEIHNVTENEQVAPDSTNSAFIDQEAETLVFSDDYVSQLKELQQKIMTLQDNQELQRVVQVIAETGQYEVTRKTFDFDLCALDRATVQRLQQFFSAS